MAGSTQARLAELKVTNPGVLDYLPDDLVSTLVLEQRPEDEPVEKGRSFEAFNPKERAAMLNEVRRERLCAVLGAEAQGTTFETCSSHDVGAAGAWQGLLLPMLEGAVEEQPVPNEYLGAHKVTSFNDDRRRGCWIANFTRPLPAGRAPSLERRGEGRRQEHLV